MEKEDVLNGKRARGRKELLRAMNGFRLTRGEAILAKCYECMNGYIDGTFDCGITDCPLHPYMPYRGKQPKNEVD